MNAYIASIALDLNAENNHKTIKVKQGDAVLRQIAITLLKDGVPYTPTSVSSSRFRVQKSDGNIVVLESTDSPSMISVTNGVYTITLTEQCLAASGRAFCDLELIDSSGNISTALFVMQVVPMPVGEDFESTSVWTELNKAIEDAEGISDNFAMRAYNGYLQYTVDGETWVNLLAMEDIPITIDSADIDAFYT